MTIQRTIFLAAIVNNVLVANAQGCEPAFNIDFEDAVLTTNTLHLPGGEMRLENLGTYAGGIEVDLVVTVVPGTVYTTPDPVLNGRSGLFGQINVQNRPSDPALDGVGEFEFCFEDNASGSLVEIESFDFTFFDLDGRGDRSYEQLTMDPSEYSQYQLSGITSEVFVQCESTNNPPPCPTNDRVLFLSSTSGGAGDNPSDPNDLTPQQQRRSVMFTFEETSCFHVTFSQICNDDPNCSVGGNLIFAGTASQLVDCDTEPPTDPPITPSPTRSPTRKPTPSPTRSPVANPVVTKFPTPSPTPLPTRSPTRNPTRSPVDEPTTPAPTTGSLSETPVFVTGASAKSSKGKGKGGTKGSSSKKEKKSKSSTKRPPKIKASSKKSSKGSMDYSGDESGDLIDIPLDSEDMPLAVESVSKSTKGEDVTSSMEEPWLEDSEDVSEPVQGKTKGKNKNRRARSSRHKPRNRLLVKGQ